MSVPGLRDHDAPPVDGASMMACPPASGGTLFRLAALLHLAGGAALLGLALNCSMRASTPWAAALCVGGAAMMVPLGCVFLVLPAILGAKAAVAGDLRASLLELNARWADLEAARREHYRARTAAESLAQSLGEEKEQLVAISRELRSAILDRQRFDEVVLAQRQEMVGLSRQIDAWRQAAMGYVRSLERVIEGSGGALPADTVSAYEKASRDYGRSVAPLGLDLIRPEAGEPFDERIHCIDGEQASADVPPGNVLRCVAWGFRWAGGVDRARVVVAQAAAQPKVAPASAAVGPSQPEA